MTKPGNSDPAERPVDAKDTEPEPPTTEPETETVKDTAKDTEPEIVEIEKAPPLPADEPVMPTAAEAARRRSELPRPRVLTIAYYLAIASGVIGAASAVMLFLSKAELVSQAQTIKTTKPLTAAEAEKAVTSLLWLYLVVVLALGAFLVLFAYKAMDGVRRARMMALIIALIVLIFHFYFFGTALGQISGLCAAITIALMYLPATRAYFPPRQTTR